MRRPTLNLAVDVAVASVYVRLAALGLPADPPPATRPARVRREHGVTVRGLSEGARRALGAR